MTWNKYPDLKPKKPGRYLVVYVNSHFICAWTGSTWVHYDGVILTEFGDVSHWQELPELPDNSAKEENEDQEEIEFLKNQVQCSKEDQEERDLF